MSLSNEHKQTELRSGESFRAQMDNQRLSRLLESQRTNVDTLMLNNNSVREECLRLRENIKVLKQEKQKVEIREKGLHSVLQQEREKLSHNKLHLNQYQKNAVQQNRKIKELHKFIKEKNGKLIEYKNQIEQTKQLYVRIVDENRSLQSKLIRLKQYESDAEKYKGLGLKSLSLIREIFREYRQGLMLQLTELLAIRRSAAAQYQTRIKRKRIERKRAMLWEKRIVNRI